MSSTRVPAPRPVHGRPLVALLFAATVVFAACGSNGSSDDSARDADTTTAEAAPTTATEVDAEADTETDAESEGTDELEGPIAFDDEFCESIPADTFLEATGGTTTKAHAMGGGGFADDISYETSSCTFELDNGTTVVVEMLIDPDTDSPIGTDYFDGLHAASEADTMSGYEHADVDGVGDRAAFVADAFDNKLMVSSQDIVFMFSGSDGDFEPLDRDQIEQIASAAFAQLG